LARRDLATALAMMLNSHALTPPGTGNRERVTPGGVKF
jgi:hypothetical protein